MSYRNIGIDLGVTAKHVAQVRDEEGKKIVKKYSFHLSKEKLDTLCKQALEGAAEGTKLRFICEPTAMSWFPIAVYAKNNGHEIVRIKSHKTHDLRKYFARHKKDDKIDANLLTVMPMIDPKAVEEIYLPGIKICSLERRNKQKRKIIEQVTAIKNRMNSLCHWIMPGLSECFENPFGARAIEFYHHFINPFKAKEAGIEGIRQVLELASRQKMKQDLPEKLYLVACNASEFYEKSSEYVDFGEIQDEVHVELGVFETLQESLSHINDRIESLYREVYPSRNIESIMGIGETLSSSIISIIGDSSRFPSQNKLRCFAGIIPRQNSSGETNKKGLSITQEGPTRLRRDIYLAAEIARQWDPQLAKIYYEEMVNKGHCHKQAVCAVATHLLNRILCILKENRPYELRDLEGKPISSKEAKRLINEKFRVSEEIRQRTRTRRSRKNKKEERIRNLFTRQPEAPQNSYNIPPLDILQKLETFVK